MPGQYILVVGGCGYIGALVCRRLAKIDATFINYDSRIYGQEPPGRATLGSHGSYCHGDIRDRSKLGALIHNASCIVWLGAIVGDAACDFDKAVTLDVNLNSIKWLAKFYPDKKFIFASTASVYGHSDSAVNEDSPLEPLSLYAETKVMAEHVIRTEMMQHTIFRLGTAFGLRPYTRKRLDLVVQAMTVDAVFENRIRVFGKDRWRPLTHIDDIARSFITAIQRECIGTYNVTLQNIRVGELAEHVADITGCENIEYFDIEYDKRDYRMDYSKALREGIISRRDYTTIDFGITEAMEQIRERDLQNPRLKNAVYLNERSCQA